MKFLYACRRVPLENIWSEWQVLRVNPRGAPMLDIVLLALGLGFFALTVVYAYVCERL